MKQMHQKRMSGRRRSRAAAVSLVALLLSVCAAQTLAGAIFEAGNEAYEIAFTETSFVYTAATGPEHPVTEAEGRQVNVLMGGWNLLPVFNHQSIRSYSSRTDYLFGGLHHIFDESPPFECRGWGEVAPLELTPLERNGRTTGLVASWTADEPPDHIRVEFRLDVRGNGFEDGAVEVTTSVENLADETLRLGIRYHWAPTIRTSLHPCYGFAPPDPPGDPFECRQKEFVDPDRHHFVASWYSSPTTPHPIYFIAGTISEPRALDPPPTPPDRIVIANHGAATRQGWERGPEFQGVANSCFDYDVTPGVGLGGSSTITYWWGRDEDHALEVPPGEKVSVTQYLWAFLENPLICDAGGPYRAECEGDPTPVPLDGSGSGTQEGNPVRYAWSSPDGRGSFGDPEAEGPTAYFPGVGVYPVELQVGIGPFTRTCDTSVEVVDTLPPELRVPAPILLRTSDFGPDACDLPATVIAEAEDLCWPDVTVTHTTEPFLGSGGAVASYLFPPGTTRVIFTAVDPSGNQASAGTTVTVLDDTPPVFTRLEALPALLWPPNHRLVEVSVEAAARDNCDSAPRITLSGVTSSEPPDDRGDGHTLPDISGLDVGTADFSLLLRAERDGRGPGRTYCLLYEAEDEWGNTAPGETAVRVPHDQRDHGR